MLGNGALALHAVSRQYTQGLRNDAAHTGAILTEDLNRLLLVGVSLDDTSRLSAYLTRAATIHGDGLVLEIIAPPARPTPQAMPQARKLRSSCRPAKSSPAGTGLVLLRQRGFPEQGWKLRASLTRGPWLERLMANGLDILTLVVISLIFMVEMFLLLSRSLEARLQGTAPTPPPPPPVPSADVRLHPGHGHDHFLHPPAHGRTHHARHAPA